MAPCCPSIGMIEVSSSYQLYDPFGSPPLATNAMECSPQAEVDSPIGVMRGFTFTKISFSTTEEQYGADERTIILFVSDFSWFREMKMLVSPSCCSAEVVRLSSSAVYETPACGLSIVIRTSLPSQTSAAVMFSVWFNTMEPNCI